MAGAQMTARQTVEEWLRANALVNEPDRQTEETKQIFLALHFVLELKAPKRLQNHRCRSWPHVQTVARERHFAVSPDHPSCMIAESMQVTAGQTPCIHNATMSSISSSMLLHHEHRRVKAKCVTLPPQKR